MSKITKDLIAVALLVIAYVFQCIWLFKMRKRVKIKAFLIPIICLLLIIASHYSANLFAVIEKGDISGWHGSSIFGAMFLCPIIVVLCSLIFRWNLDDACDELGLCLILSYLSFRASCFIYGCCLGTIIPGTDGHLWPFRELDIIFYATFLVIFTPKVIHKETHGTCYPTFMVTYGIFRFFIDWTKASWDVICNISWLRWASLWSVLLVIVGSFWIIAKKKRNAHVITIS